MYKKIIFSLALAFIASFSINAQRIAIVDVNAILSAMPEYTKAQDDIDVVAAKWRQEIAEEYDKIKSLYNKYQAEQVLLSDEAKTEKEEEIMELEKSVRKLQNARFGPEGDLFKQRQELVSPIQDKVFSAIENYAAEKGYDLIFDKAGAAGLLYTTDEFDKTSTIKRRLKID